MRNVCTHTCFILLFGLLACGDDDAPSADASPPDGATGDSFRAVFAPAADPMPWGATPFPDDLYLDADGHIALADYPNESASEFPSYVAALRRTLEDLDGFGLTSPVYFPIEGDVDPASLPADGESLSPEASAFLVDADPASPTAFQRVPVQARWVPAHRAIALRPADGHSLQESARYAAVLTTRVRSTSGAPLMPAERFAELRDADAAPSNPLLAEARDRYEPVLASLAAGGTARDTVSALAVFRTQSVTTELRLVREALWSTDDVPTPTVDRIVSGEDLDALLGTPSEDLIGFGVPGGIVHDSVGWLVQGSFQAPWYLDDQPGVHGPFERQGDAIRVKRTEQVPFTLVLPRTATSSPLRVVVFQHGITADRSDGLGLAETLCAAGWGLAMIDAPFHGQRALGGDSDVRNRFTGEEVPDGFGDKRGPAVIVDFAGLQDFAGDLADFHPVYFRDAMRQSAADLLAFVRLLRTGDWSALATEDATLEGFTLADDRFGFVGYSLGGIIGTSFVASEPEIGAAYLAFTGGAIVHAVAESPAFNSAYLPQLFPLLGLDIETVDYERLHPSFYPELALWATLFDRGDSLGYARALRRSDVSVLMAMARHDETLPNVNTESLARALGAPMIGGEPLYVDLEPATAPLRANVSGEGFTRTRGLQLFESANHGALVYREDTRRYEAPPRPPFEALDTPMTIVNPVEAVQGQLVRFFETWRAGAAEIATLE